MRFFIPLIAASALLLVFADPTCATAQTTANDIVESKEQWKKLNSDKVIILKNEMGEGKEDDSHAATAAIIVDAPLKDIWAVISDKEGAPDFVKNLKNATIVEQKGNTALVEQTVKIGMLKEVTYVIKNVSNPPNGMTFSRHSGDLKAIDGYWRLYPIEKGKKTLVVYRLGLKPGFAVPAFMIKNSLKSSLPEALREVRGEVARRANS